MKTMMIMIILTMMRTTVGPLKSEHIPPAAEFAVNTITVAKEMHKVNSRNIQHKGIRLKPLTHDFTNSNSPSAFASLQQKHLVG